MIRSASLASLALLALAPPSSARAAGGDIPPEPGLYWEQQVEMQMAGFAMPAQTSKVCLPKKGMQEPPPGKDDGKCKMTDVKRSGAKMSWKMTCEDGTTGDGELTSSPDSYSGAMTMRTQGREMRMKMAGKKVGGDCDANEMKRRAAGVKQQVAEMQSQQAQAQAEQCANAEANMTLAPFVAVYPGVPVPCKDASKFCAALETRKGLAAFRANNDMRSGNQAKAEKLCGKDIAGIEKKLCAAAAKEQDKGVKYADGDTMEFIFGSCPDLAKSLAKRECAGRSFTSLPQKQREFCTRWASRSMEEPASGTVVRDPAASRRPSQDSTKYMKSGLPDPDAAAAAKKAKKKPADEDQDDGEGKAKDPEDMKSKIMKGIFGR